MVVHVASGVDFAGRLVCAGNARRQTLRLVDQLRGPTHEAATGPGAGLGATGAAASDTRKTDGR